MLQLKDTDLKFLIITRGFWGKGDNIKLLKRKAARDSTWEKGAERQYFLYLVHKDTELNKELNFVFPSELAQASAIYLGTI
jgi:hypothetical protein